jgi:hypothetical protein
MENLRFEEGENEELDEDLRDNDLETIFDALLKRIDERDASAFLLDY